MIRCCALRTVVLSSLFDAQFFCFHCLINKPTMVGSKTYVVGLGLERKGKKEIFFSVHRLQLTQVPSG